MAHDTADATPLPARVPGDTVLTDRQLLIHILQHAEDISTRIGRLEELLDEFAPLIDRYRKRGRRIL